MSSWVALLPLKPPGLRKSRLAPVLSAAERDRLSEAMFAHVAATLDRHRQIAHVIVVAAVRPAGWTGALALDRGRGLNAELTAARAAAGAENLLILPADLPLVDGADVTTLLDEAEAAGVALAPDRHGAGTNALALLAGSDLRFCFGPQSFAEHLAQAPGAAIVRRGGFALDLDTVEDLERALAAGFTCDAIADFCGRV